MKNDPLISVIIPVLNRDSYLPTAVESVLNQSYKHFELIIVDDHSKDETFFSIIPYLKDKRVSYFYLNKNFGVSFARNFGINKAKGEFIAFLDSDDYWLKKKLEKQLKYMTENNFKICQTEEIWIRNGKFVNPKKKHKKIEGDIFEKSLELCIVSPSAVLIEKKIFEDVGGFDEKMIACEDYDLWLRISLKYKVGLLKEKLIVKRNGQDDQLSKIKSLDKFRIYSILKLLEKENLDSNKKKLAIKTLLKKSQIYINGCLKRGRYEEAKYYQTIIERYKSFSNTKKNTIS